MISAADLVLAPSGLILPKRIAQARYAPRQPVGVGLFAGAGGFDLGVKSAGFHVIAASEWDALATITYMVNLCRWGEVTLHIVEPGDGKRLESALRKTYKQTGRKKAAIVSDIPLAGTGWISHEPRSTRGTDHVFFGDVRKLTSARLLRTIGMEVGDIDLMFGGPPCQGYSTAGKRNVMDPRNSLVFDMIRLVVETKPKAMALENVAGIATMMTDAGLPVVDAMARALEDGGFGALDSLKRSMSAQGLTLLRGVKPRKGGSADAEAEHEEAPATITPQGDLFGAAA